MISFELRLEKMARKTKKQSIGLLSFLCKDYKKDIFHKVIMGFEPYVFYLSKHPQYVVHRKCLDEPRLPT